MHDELLKVLESYTMKNRLRRGWKKFVQIMACFVVFCTTYALILPAITQESDIYCGIAEHTHEDACYAQASEVNRQLACPVTGDVAHSHNEDCLDESGSLVCTLPEQAQHIHTEECYAQDTETDETSVPAEPVLICTDPLAVVHVHSEDCFLTTEAEAELICGQEAHVHTLICHSDPEADLETQEIWEQSIAFAELTGVWNEDVVSIAMTQRGYVESTRNYIVLEDETTRGYTRYGAWYGDPYGDWAAMFASFCLDYAGVEGIPLESDVSRWMEALSAAELYRSQGSYVPGAGELIFFDSDADGAADHVGILTDLTVGEEGTVPQITTIEGDSTNRVQELSYSLDDESIIGYGLLPVQLTAGEQAAVNLVIAKIDALPTAAEIEAALAQFRAESDSAGEEAYYAQVSQQVAEAYHLYTGLNDAQKQAVPNADKLLELEEIWSVTEYIAYDPIQSDAVTTIQSAHTGDLVELNLYDYYGWYSAAAAKKTDINHRFDQVSQEFPGFQWSGGAYPYKYYTAENGWIADRHLSQSIDFGNSLITDYRITDAVYEPDQAVAWDDGYLGQQSPGFRPVTDEDGATGAFNLIISGGDLPIGVVEGAAVVSGRLGSDGYPYLTYSGEDIEDYDPSLRYLFDENHADRFAGKANAENIDGLFRLDPVSGEYFYNSLWNHAQFNEATSSFTLYDQVITPNFIRYPFGNFLPFHNLADESSTAQVQAFNYQGGVKDYILATLADLEDLNAAAQGADLSVIQLIRMLESYQASWEASGEWDALTAAQAMEDYLNGKTIAGDLKELYNIHYDVEKNFFFGMDMQMTFLQPKNGLTGSDNGSNETGTWEWAWDKNGDTLTEVDDTLILTGEKDGIPDYPMVFSFTGDDDVWVYIDGIRFLDLSGVHNAVAGRIDFEKGLVSYYPRDPETVSGTEEEPCLVQSFREILTGCGVAEDDLGKYLKQDADGNYTTFHDYSAHTLKFYYLERGSGFSLCDLRFNLPLIRKNTLTVTSEMTNLDGEAQGNGVLGNPDHYFNLITSNGALFVGPDSVTGITQYKIQDSTGNILKNEDGTDKIFATDDWGIFTLKAGQTAVFEGIGACAEEFFLQELIPAEDNGQYPVVTINDRETQGNQLIDWGTRSYFCPEEQTEPVYEGPYGYRWYGRSGQTTDAAVAESFVFMHSGQVDPGKLGSLSITQELIGAETDRSFQVEVTLDGVKLPVGTAYTVDGQERTVAEEGIIALNSGETAIIGNILSGTRFAVWEVDAEPYTVSYAWPGSRSVDSDGYTQNDGVSGVIRTESNAAVTVINAEDGAAVQIPVSAALANGDGQEHSFTFILEQVTDSTGAAPVENGTVLQQTVTITDTPVSFSFNLSYLMTQLDTIPATFFYRITETGEATDCLENDQQFVAEILVEKTEEGIQATLTGINGSSDLQTAEFVNTLAGSLTISTTVNGDAAHKGKTFDFTLTLTPPENVELPAEIQAVLTAADGTQSVLTLQPENGKIQIEALTDGASLVVTGIPAGTQWNLYQNYVDGFITTTRIGESTMEGRMAEGTVVTGDTAVAYINTQTYVLPKTGGTGTHLYTMAGWMLMLCSAAYLLYKYALRRRGAFMNP